MDTTVILTSLLVASLLQCVAIYDQTWHSVTIKIDICDSCGQFIVQVGEVMENCTFNNESSATYSDASSVATDTNNSTVWKRLYNSYRYSRTKREVSKATMYSDDYVRVNVTIDQDKDVIKNFEIRDSLLVNMGLWRTRICVPDTMGCVQLYPSQASEIFSRMPSLLALQGTEQLL
ncbi:hypothetical protein DPMN_132504 [Dreissena polymorpha]|uniref:Uncharacterized protein n=1 Tax=Dreissena polymorpha TaxID=45954 RepID=A0A9D4FTI9_DREPO|nr:hypothetical protein DPMN_132504 [Dreissena polymorpha]